MSFRLHIDYAENLGGETRIGGRLVKGAYFGPQYVRLKDTTGKERTARILSHALVEPQGWPITPDHDTQLVLYLANPNPPFSIDTNSPIEGLGSVLLRRDSIDLTNELMNPLFWGNFSVLYMTSESREEPYEEFLGLSQDEVNSYYTDFLLPLIDSETWPIISLPIDDNRYVEFESAGGAEFQERLWIGSRVSGYRALLGYDSGHFSLPALRPSELVWLLEKLEYSKTHPASGLLLVPMCYLPESDAILTEKVANLCASIPDARVELASAMADNMMSRQIAPEANWERRPGLGWCSNWEYS